MMSRYFIENGSIHFGISGDSYLAARCDMPEKAVELLNWACRLNNYERKYTAAARKINTAENLPGFEWKEVVS